MRQRDFMIALAVCAGLAAPVTRGLFHAAPDSHPLVAQATASPARPVTSPSPATAPTPDQARPTPAPQVPPEASPTPRSCDYPPTAEPPGDGCPSCGMARVEPRGKEFLKTYSRP